MRPLSIAGLNSGLVTLGVDRDYWAGEHPRPMTPDASDVAVFVEEIGDARTVLLLGNTRALMPLCTAAMDIDPFLEDPRVIKQDWRTNTVSYDAMIGDGLLNFDQDFTREILDMAQGYCHSLVVRTFTRHLPPMRVATFFPQPEDFHVQPSGARFSPEGYAFYTWIFR